MLETIEKVIEEAQSGRGKSRKNTKNTLLVFGCGKHIKHHELEAECECVGKTTALVTYKE